jgi:signal transduction histidine kinase
VSERQAEDSSDRSSSSAPARGGSGHLGALQSIVDAALGHLELDALLDELLLRIRDILRADTAAILLLDPGANELVARAAKGLEEEVDAGVRVPVGRGFAGRIAAERRTVAVEDVDHADLVNPILRQKRIRSLLGAPLFVRGEVTGVVHVGTLSPRVFSAEDHELLQFVADRAALAIDHGRAYEAEHALAERLRRLQAVTDVALGHLEPRGLLDELVHRVREILDADTCAVLLLDEERHELVARAAAGLEEEVEAGVRIPLARGFAGRIAAERRPVVIDDLEHADVVNPILREKGLSSLLGAPLLARDRVLGVIHVGSFTPRAFTPDETELLQTAAERAALGLERALLQERLIELDRVRNAFVAVASHELRTPAAAILGSALTLRARHDTLPLEQEEALREILATQAERLAALVEQLLDLSQLEAHGVPIRRERACVRELVDRTLALIEPAQREHVTVDVDPELEAEVDALAFDRIVSNLVVNALRHGAPPVVVSARRHRGNDELRVVVEDAGNGVPEDIRSRLFDGFARGADASGGPGSGLGLAIARSYAHAHGGDIVLDDDAPPGARFVAVISLAAP